jgi:hypothetical protein
MVQKNSNTFIVTDENFSSELAWDEEGLLAGPVRRLFQFSGKRY